jgi:hypothetical protein
MTTPRRVRIEGGRIWGRLLIEGQQVGFEANILGPNIDATFTGLPEGVTDWDAFKLLEGFLIHYTRGSHGDTPPTP